MVRLSGCGLAVGVAGSRNPLFMSSLFGDSDLSNTLQSVDYHVYPFVLIVSKSFIENHRTPINLDSRPLIEWPIMPLK